MVGSDLSTREWGYDDPAHTARRPGPMSDSDLTSKSRLSGATSGQGFGAERADRPAATEASFAEGRRRRGRLEMH